MDDFAIVIIIGLALALLITIGLYRSSKNNLETEKAKNDKLITEKEREKYSLLQQIKTYDKLIAEKEREKYSLLQQIKTCEREVSNLRTETEKKSKSFETTDALLNQEIDKLYKEIKHQKSYFLGERETDKIKFEKQLNDCEKELKKQSYKLQLLETMCPEVKKLFEGENIVLTKGDIVKRTENLFEIVDMLKMPRFDKDRLLISMKKRVELLESSQSNLTAIPYMAAIMADYELHELKILEMEMGLDQESSMAKLHTVREIRAEAMEIAQRNHEGRYKLEYILFVFPELRDFLKQNYSQVPMEELKKIKDAEKRGLEKRIEFLEKANSNLKAIPYMAAIMADYETYGLEALAKQLDWGFNTERDKKVISIREIRKAAKDMVEKNLFAKYQLEYLMHLFPALEDVLETDYNQLPVISVQELSEYDKTRDWLSKEEYQSLSTVERNQLALDRYKASHTKTKWQIGRDYEMYVGFVYGKKGYNVNYFGSTMGMEDLGRDLIVSKGGKTAIIQCKYWSKEKTIHEKHILQLYGTVTSYKIENNLQNAEVKGILITNICLSDMAKKMADYLNIQYVEKYEKKDYPCIKCNIGRDKYGYTTKIYHLPFDQQYDSTQIKNEGEFFAMTVKEAEDAGFRRAFKWFGND